MGKAYISAKGGRLEMFLYRDIYHLVYCINVYALICTCSCGYGDRNPYIWDLHQSISGNGGSPLMPAPKSA